MRGFVTLSLLFSAVFAVVAPGTVHAAGIQLEGNLVNSSKPIIGTTGNCACVWEWNTVALRPGATTIRTKVNSPATTTAKTYRLSVVVYAQNMHAVLKKGTVTCLAAKRPCGKTLVLHLNVHRAGVFYIQVQGRDADTLWYSMSVAGNIRPLHCNFKKHRC